MHGDHTKLERSCIYGWVLIAFTVWRQAETVPRSRLHAADGESYTCGLG